MSFVVFGAGGIGLALAKRLLAAGYPVTLAARRQEQLAAAAATLNHSSLLTTAAVDVLDTAALEAACAAVAARGPVQGLAFAVGSIPLASIKAAKPANVLSAFSLNALAPFVALRALAPALGAGVVPGSAVLFSSVAAGTGFPSHAAIAMAKGAVESLARTAAAELAPKVRVNVVAPSLTTTPLAARLLASESMASALAASHPLRRLGTADEVAAAAEFLLVGDGAAWVTGQTLHVDGGRSALILR